MPNINYFSEKTSQDIILKFYYNDGFFNRDISIQKTIITKPYSDLIPNAVYTNSIPDRNTDLKFKDGSSNNESRIIDIDWELTDRYENNSMVSVKQGEDNLQLFNNIKRDIEITTNVYANENHTLSQKVIRWDNGFHLKTFTRSYIITTSIYSINPSFTYKQIYNTGPEIRFTNTSTKNTGAILLDYSLEIEDKENDGTDAFAQYNHINLSTEIDHTYKSVSNSPFENDIANKEVTIFVDYDDGFNRVYNSYTENIIVKPNRITQDFLTTPERKNGDLETSDFIITGNNPIEFHDISVTERTDTNFIKKVEYIIIEDC